jgi:hypothetical protein
MYYCEWHYSLNIALIFDHWTLLSFNFILSYDVENILCGKILFSLHILRNLRFSIEFQIELETNLMK